MKLTKILVGLTVLRGGVCQQAPVIRTNSGILHGITQDGVMSFKGIPFAQPPVGLLRFEPPVPFVSTVPRNATTLGPACLQQFGTGGSAALDMILFNNPPPPESEDCLFLNVWAPADMSDPKKAVMVWLFGGGLAFGTGSLAAYDGTSFAKNQNIVVVTTNYRTNAFGFPGAEELFPAKENLGFLDQELTLQWVQQNVAAFGGDPTKVTIMGESAGALSVALAIQRHPVNPPFRAGIMESGTAGSMTPIPSFTSFDALAKAVNCTQSPGAARLSCMKAVPAQVIHDWTNSPQGMSFGPVVDNITTFVNPLQRIARHQTARIPILLGANQNDGSLFTLGVTDLDVFLQQFGGLVTPAQIRTLYPGLSDIDIISTAFRDFAFVCPDELTATAFIQAGMPNVFRYIYGAVFADLQAFPNAGAFHSSEIREVFGTFNATTASQDEKILSHTLQTVWANFIKNPTVSPAPNWLKFVPGNSTNSLAKLAFNGNVDLNSVVEAVPGDADDGPCNALWNSFLL